MRLLRSVKTGLPVLKGILFKQRVPFLVNVKLTWRCNLRCPYCLVYEQIGNKEEMTLDQLKGLVNDLAAMGCVKLGFGGGEPLLREDVDQIGLYAKEKGLYLAVSTNGMLIDRHIDFLKQVDLTIVSLDGNREVNERQRGNPLSDRIVANMRRLVDAGGKVMIASVITNKHDMNLQPILELARDLKCRASFQPVMVNRSTTGPQTDAMLLDSKQLVDLLELLVKLRKQGEPIYYPVSLHKYFLDCLKGVRSPAPCMAGRFFVDIDPSGTLEPCSNLCDQSSENNLVRKGGFRKAFEELPPPNCPMCYWFCYWHNNLIFSLDMPTILNGLLHL